MDRAKIEMLSVAMILVISAIIVGIRNGKELRQVTKKALINVRNKNLDYTISKMIDKEFEREKNRFELMNNSLTQLQ